MANGMICFFPLISLDSWLVLLCRQCWRPHLTKPTSFFCPILFCAAQWVIFGTRVCCHCLCIYQNYKWTFTSFFFIAFQNSTLKVETESVMCIVIILETQIQYLVPGVLVLGNYSLDEMQTWLYETCTLGNDCIKVLLGVWEA